MFSHSYYTHANTPSTSTLPPDLLATFNFSIEFVAPECVGTGSGANPYILRYVLTLLLPLVLGLVLAGVYAVYVAVGVIQEKSQHWYTEARRSVLQSAAQLCLVLYLPLSIATLEFFDCVPVGVSRLAVQCYRARVIPISTHSPSRCTHLMPTSLPSLTTRSLTPHSHTLQDVKVLASSPDVVCGGDTWNSVLPMAAIFLCLYTLAGPVIYTVLLGYMRFTMGVDDFVVRFGFLANRYIPEYYYYESWVMFRKLGVAVTLTFVTASAYVQAGAAVVWLLLMFFVHTRFRPYQTRALNDEEAGCLLMLIVLLQLNLMFREVAAKSDSFLGVVVLLVLLGLLVVIVAGVLAEAYEGSLMGFSGVTAR